MKMLKEKEKKKTSNAYNVGKGSKKRKKYIYAPNIGTPRYLQQILTDIKGESDGDAITVGEFNNPHTSEDRDKELKSWSRAEPTQTAGLHVLLR